MREKKVVSKETPKIKFNFNHKKSDFFGSMGVSPEIAKDLANQFNKITQEKDWNSEIVEEIYNNFSKEEIVLIMILLKVSYDEHKK